MGADVARHYDPAALAAELRRTYPTAIEPHMNYQEIHLRLGRAEVIAFVESMAMDPAVGYSDSELIELGMK